MDGLKIIFMGTPTFAVPALKQLIQSRHKVIGVYTKPPKISGRGHVTTPSPIHKLALANNIKVFTPETFKMQENIEQYLALNADITVVAAYGLILRKPILEGTKFGCINIHPSSLPRWRGAAPLQHTILAGDKHTSVCIMKMDEGLDTGEIILQKNLDVSDTMTTYELHDLTAEIGANMVLEALEQFQNNTIAYTKQSEHGVTYANKLNSQDELVKWDQPEKLVHCQIRAFSPKPGAYFRFNNEIIKIIEAVYKNEGIRIDIPGKVVDSHLSIACKTGIIQPTLVQREGRKVIYTEAFLRGFPIPQGTLLN